MYTCPKCERELRNPNQWHYCEKVNITDLFKNKDAELEFVFDKLLAEIVDWDNVAVSATKNCIVFVHRKTFLIIKPMKKALDLKFYTENQQFEAPIIKSVLYSGKYENHVRVATLDDVTATIFNYIKQSYSLL